MSNSLAFFSPKNQWIKFKKSKTEHFNFFAMITNPIINRTQEVRWKFNGGKKGNNYVSRNFQKLTRNITLRLWNNLFNKRNSVIRRKHNLYILNRNSVIFGDISLRFLGPHILIPGNVTEQISFAKFKESINNW